MRIPMLSTAARFLQHIFLMESASSLRSISRRGPLVLMGDFNPRLHKRLDSDFDFVRPSAFGSADETNIPGSNRDLLYACRS